MRYSSVPRPAKIKLIPPINGRTILPVPVAGKSFSSSFESLSDPDSEPGPGSEPGARTAGSEEAHREKGSLPGRTGQPR